MKLKLFLFLGLTGLVSVAVSVLQTVPHKYDLVMIMGTWSSARNYCMVKYSDLARMQSATDWLRFMKELASKGQSEVWVALYEDINSWRWSFNNISLQYSYWCKGDPNNLNGIESCAAIGSSGYWYDTACAILKAFICYNANFSDAAKFIGIPSPHLNWSDAQTYCRTHYTDLASSMNSSDNSVLVQICNIQGDSWFGLYRDTWKWSDGTKASNLPWAPGQPDNYGGIEHCAVISYGFLGDVPCTNQYYFFCDTNYPARSQRVRLQVRSDGSVFDPAVQSSILLQVQQTLEENGMMKNTTVTWKVQPDGNIFHKKMKDDL